VKTVADVPLNRTSVVPVKFVPLIVTTVPTGPLMGEKDEIVGVPGTVKFVALHTVPSGVQTEILPVVAPVGTVAVIFVEESTVNIAECPLNRTSVAPVKFVPLIVTTVPTGPLVGEKDEIVGLAAHDDGAAAIMTPSTERTTTVLGRSMLRDRDIEASFDRAGSHHILAHVRRRPPRPSCGRLARSRRAGCAPNRP
jgi:hypothetical protein